MNSPLGVLLPLALRLDPTFFVVVVLSWPKVSSLLGNKRIFPFLTCHEYLARVPRKTFT